MLYIGQTSSYSVSFLMYAVMVTETMQKKKEAEKLNNV
jgi:hypothetical protein